MVQSFSQFYHQLPLAEYDQEKTALYANGQLYHYVRCPFGLKNAVAYCCRLMAKVLNGIENVLVYLDDVLIHGRTQAQHDTALQQLLERIETHNLSLNQKKCRFNQSSITFPGYKVENGKVKPDPDRLKPLLNFPVSNSAKVLQSFVGMVTYYSKYIPNFSHIMKPFQWKILAFKDFTDDDVSLFDNIKEEIS